MSDNGKLAKKKAEKKRPPGGKRCLLQNCRKYRARDGIGVFSFPKPDTEPERHKEWCRVVKHNRPDFKYNPFSSVLCADHFADDQIANLTKIKLLAESNPHDKTPWMLVPGAVPLISKLPPPRPSSSSTPRHPAALKRKRRKITGNEKIKLDAPTSSKRNKSKSSCCVPDCNTPGDFKTTYGSRKFLKPNSVPSMLNRKKTRRKKKTTKNSSEPCSTAAHSSTIVSASPPTSGSTSTCARDTSDNGSSAPQIEKPTGRKKCSVQESMEGDCNTSWRSLIFKCRYLSNMIKGRKIIPKALNPETSVNEDHHEKSFYGRNQSAGGEETLSRFEGIDADQGQQSGIILQRNQCAGGEKKLSRFERVDAVQDQQTGTILQRSQCAGGKEKLSRFERINANQGQRTFILLRRNESAGGEKKLSRFEGIKVHQGQRTFLILRSSRHVKTVDSDSDSLKVYMDVAKDDTKVITGDTDCVGYEEEKLDKDNIPVCEEYITQEDNTWVGYAEENLIKVDTCEEFIKIEDWDDQELNRDQQDPLAF